MTRSSHITLAIESAIGGGSLSLLRGDREIATWIGASNVSKAEDLLVNIDELLSANSIDKHEIDLVAVSAGPGSFTGIRIGIATVLGLKTGLGIQMSSESALRAMVFLQPDNVKILAAVPMGRNSVCLQSFQKKEGKIFALDEPYTRSEEEFLQIPHEQYAVSVLHAILYEKIGPLSNTVNFGTNIAYAIGKTCRQNPELVTEPLFIAKSF